jgi:hypothetical protein
MKQIILILMTGIVMLSLSSCSEKPVEIAQNEAGYYGLKQGSKWIAEPEYVKMKSLNAKEGTFFIGKRVPGTQKYYHVLFDSKGKMLKECNIGRSIFSDDGSGLWETKHGFVLDYVTPEEQSGILILSTMEEIPSTSDYGGYEYNYSSGKDIFSEKEK